MLFEHGEHRAAFSPSLTLCQSWDGQSQLISFGRQDGPQAVADALLGHSYSTSIPLCVGSLQGDTGFLNTYSKTLFIQRIHTYSY